MTVTVSMFSFVGCDDVQAQRNQTTLQRNILIETLTLTKNAVQLCFLLQWYSNDSYQFECQHGTKECFGNIVQACAINVFHDPVHIFNYVTCLMTEVIPSEVKNDTYPVDSVSDVFSFRYRLAVGFEPFQSRCSQALK